MFRIIYVFILFIITIHLSLFSQEQKYPCPAHPEIQVPQFDTCTKCDLDIIFQHSPGFPPDVLAIIENSWKQNSYGQQELKVLPQDYIYNLVITGAAADGYSEQIFAVSALLQQYKDKKFAMLVEKVFHDKKYELIDLATYFIAEKKRYDLLSLVENFLNENDDLACKEFVDLHINAAWCLASFGKKEQAITVLQQHLNKDEFSGVNVWYALTILLYMDTPTADKILLQYLNNKTTNKRLSDYYKNFLKGKKGESIALQRITANVKNGDNYAQNFLKKYYPKKALLLFGDLFAIYHKRESLSIEQWQQTIDFATYLANNNDPEAVMWLQQQLKENRNTLKFMLLMASDLSHAKLQKTLYQLLIGDENDFYIACFLIKHM